MYGLRFVVGVLAFSLSLPTLAAAAQLLVIEDSRCAVCLRFNATVGRSYSATAQGQKAPLRRVNIARKVPADIALIKVRGGPLRGTPIFFLVDKGREIGRFDGFSNAQDFWTKLDRLLATID